MACGCGNNAPKEVAAEKEILIEDLKAVIKAEMQ
jgi:hypothetical protein